MKDDSMKKVIAWVTALAVMLSCAACFAEDGSSGTPVPAKIDMTK